MKRLLIKTLLIVLMCQSTDVFAQDRQYSIASATALAVGAGGSLWYGLAKESDATIAAGIVGSLLVGPSLTVLAGQHGLCHTNVVTMMGSAIATLSIPCFIGALKAKAAATSPSDNGWQMLPVLGTLALAIGAGLFSNKSV